MTVIIVHHLFEYLSVITDIFNILRLCDIHNIPLATNLATAELLIKALERGDLDWRDMYK